jgi:uncharacterized GH25 family protein
MEAARKLTPMRILAIIATLILSAHVLSAECVEITPAVHLSSDNVRITTVFNGSALRDAKVEIFFATEQKPGLVVFTDSQGVASIPKLAHGFYRVVATGPKNQTAELSLYVNVPALTSITSFEMILVPSVSLLDARLAIAEKTPITRNIHEFKGLLLDPSGAAISGAEIEIIRKNSKPGPAAKVKSDESGRFKSTLDDGTYVAFFQASGFRTEIVAFELDNKPDPKELRISMRIGGC